MSFDSLLNHKCDIYHIIRIDKSPGFGLAESPAFEYAKTPDVSEEPCHFGHFGASTVFPITQNEPQAVMDAQVKLALPMGADIRLNDKVVDCDTGLEYTAGHPRKVREHHKIVYLRRTKEQAIL